MSLSQLTGEAGKDPNKTTAKNFGPLLKYSPVFLTELKSSRASLRESAAEII